MQRRGAGAMSEDAQRGSTIVWERDGHGGARSRFVICSAGANPGGLGRGTPRIQNSATAYRAARLGLLNHNRFAAERVGEIADQRFHDELGVEVAGEVVLGVADALATPQARAANDS